MPLDFPDDDNGDVLRRMQKGGDNFAKSRDVDFSVVFPSESAASDFAAHFRELGFKVAVAQSDCVAELPWDVTITKRMPLSHEGITEIEALLEANADLLGGRNDGWGCFRQVTEN